MSQQLEVDSNKPCRSSTDFSAEYPYAARYAKPYCRQAQQRLERAERRADTGHP